MILDYTSHSNPLPFTQQVSHSFTSELQWSPNFLISVVLKGNISIHYRNHTRDFATNDYFFFPPFELFSFPQAEAETRVLTFSVDADFINHLCPDIDSLILQQSHLSCNLNNETYLRICRGFSAIIFNNLKNETCSRLKLLEAITDILITLFETYGIKNEDAVRHEYATDRVIAILHYINEHYTSRITVGDIADYLGIHPQYFSSFFSKNFHTGFVDYLTTFRINRSLERLVYSDDSILTIALDYGFSNHKTYAAAFRRLYQMSPTEYRREHSLQAVPKETAGSGATETDFGIFSYFRQFLATDSYMLSPGRSLQKRQTISLDASALLHTAHHTRHECFLTIGRAYACLRSEVQQQIIQAKKDFPFSHIRLRDIFSDDLYVYYEDADKEPIINWQSLDSVFDFLLSLGLKPFPEIGYMPEKLASKKQYSGWQYHPNISYPKSLDKWTYLLRSFLLHYIDRYGIAELRNWYFDFWTCPDLKIKNAYWHESMEDFFDFYKASYDVFQEIDGSLRLGSPNFSTIHGFPWYEAFFQYCYANHLYPAFISAHIYGSEQKGDDVLFHDFNEISNIDFSISNQNLVAGYLEQLHQIMNRFGFRSLEVIVSDWSLSFVPKDLIRDTCYMGPYIAHTYAQTMELARALCYWSLSDIHEDFFPESTLFRGGPGMMDYHGLKKASYNTMVLLGKLGRQVLKQGENYLFVRKENTYQLLVYNLIAFDYLYSLIDQSAMDATHRYNIYANTEDLFLNIMLPLPKGTYYIKKYEVNRSYGSAYDIWGEMGFPAVLSKDMEDYIRESSVPHLSYALQDVENTLILDEKVPAHGVMLLEIIPK